jgi:hypothetical protein
MDEDVYVGIDVSKTELVVAVRPSGKSFTLAYHRAGLKQLAGRLGELSAGQRTIGEDRPHRCQAARAVCATRATRATAAVGCGDSGAAGIGDPS